MNHAAYNHHVAMNSLPDLTTPAPGPCGVDLMEQRGDVIDLAEMIVREMLSASPSLRIGKRVLREREDGQEMVVFDAKGDYHAFYVFVLPNDRVWLSHDANYQSPFDAKQTTWMNLRPAMVYHRVKSCLV